MTANPQDEVVNISKGTTIARMELLSVDSVTTVNKKVRGISRFIDAPGDITYGKLSINQTKLTITKSTCCTTSEIPWPVC